MTLIQIKVTFLTMTSKVVLKRCGGGWCNMVNMDSKNTVYFCVVQFLQKPHPNIDQYAIVPDSWIMPRGDRVCVLYPDKRESAKLDRFYTMDPNNKRDNIKWTPYLSELKHTANDYQDAKKYIQKVCGQPKRRSSKTEPTLQFFNKSRKRCRNDSLDHCPTESKVKHQPDINPIVGMMAEHLCKEFLPAFLQRSLSGQRMEEFLHTNVHDDDSYDDDDYDDNGNATRPKNKRASSVYEDEDSDSDYVDAEPRTKRRLTFVLPPEYDEKDSRWTLRHRELGPGLEKLVPEFEVYIDTSELNNILNVSTSSIQLARLLFLKIYSDNALVTCSLTGAKASKYYSDIRPGLDADGRDALLKFVRYWEEKQQWNPVDVNSIGANLRATLTQRRRLQARASSGGHKK